MVNITEEFIELKLLIIFGIILNYRAIGKAKEQMLLSDFTIYYVVIIPFL